MRSIAVLFAAMALAACGAESSAGQDAATLLAVDARLDAQLALMNSKMPLEIDTVTKMTGVTRNGPGITYSYEVAIPQIKWTQQMFAHASQRAISGNCSERDTRLLIDLGYSLRHLYFDQQGLFVTNILVSKDKCVAP